MLDKPVTDLSVTPNILQASILRHLTFTVGKDAPHASAHDWRMALSHAIRDQTEAAYRRSDALEKRRALMDAK